MGEGDVMWGDGSPRALRALGITGQGAGANNPSVNASR